jgi:hypothetical protein
MTPQDLQPLHLASIHLTCVLKRLEQAPKVTQEVPCTRFLAERLIGADRRTSTPVRNVYS